jgi:hypothetical protein
LTSGSSSIGCVDSGVDVARQQWVESYRRLPRGPDGAFDPLVQEQIDTVTEALRRRIGGHFTLAELATTYASADHWAREAIAERAQEPGWSRTAASAADAAFHLYSPGARDYRP